MRVTQKAIAEKLGFSISLVSRSLSGGAKSIGVPDETIQLVEKTAREMGYRPNVAAQSLKGKSPKTIGVVVYDFSDPFFTDFAGKLQVQFHEIGFSTLLVGFSGRQMSERDLSPLKERDLDAIIVLGSDTHKHLGEYANLAPIFRIGHGMEEEGSICFMPNETKMGYDLVEHLQSCNAQSIEIVYPKNSKGLHPYRAEQFFKELKGTGFDVRKNPIRLEQIFEDSKSYILNCPMDTIPDTIVCTMDRVAIGILHGLLERGVEVPSRVKVIGVDDIQISKQFYPALTTFSQPMDTVLQKIMKRILAKEFEVSREFFDCPLVIRQTT